MEKYYLMKNNDDIMTLALKAVRKKNREDEIKYFGKSISYCTVFKNKKKYNRKIKHKNN